jgi:hypothetical protein
MQPDQTVNFLQVDDGVAAPTGAASCALASVAFLTEERKYSTPNKQTEIVEYQTEIL